MTLKTTYDPDRDIPSLEGKVVVITGGTAGLGREVILALTKHAPSHVFFTGRNGTAAENVIQAARAISPSTTVNFVYCDQTSLASVQSAGKQILSGTDRIDVLICNAGIMGGLPGLTKDGYEIQFGLNYLSHALLVEILLPALERTATDHGDCRVVFVSSDGYKLTPKKGIVFDELKTTQENLGLGSKWLRYGQSKLAMVLYARQLSKRCPRIMAVSLHPGVIHTNLIDGLPFADRLFLKAATFGRKISLREGTFNICWAATSPRTAGLVSGGIYEPVGEAMQETRFTSDTQMEPALWNWTSEQLEAFL